MALQSSGAISLNEIHIEAGGSSGSQASINDSDIRGLISKASGAQMSFSEWYGASSGVSIALNYGDNITYNHASSATAYNSMEGPTWSQFVTNAQNAGQGNPGLNNGYSTDSLSRYYQTNIGSQSAPVTQRRSQLPNKSGGTYNGARASIYVIAAIGGSINVSLYSENNWNIASTSTNASSSAHSRKSGQSDPNWGTAAASNLFSSITLTDHNGGTVTVQASAFGNNGTPNTTTDKQPYNTVWSVNMVNLAAWGTWNPRNSGNIGDSIGSNTFNWQSGNITASLSGY